MGRHSAYGYGVAAILLWSTVASAFKIALRTASPGELHAYAVSASTVFLVGLAASRGRLRSVVPSCPREALTSAAAGFLNPFLYYRVLFCAYDRLPAQEALVLNYLWPITLSVLAVPFLGQPLRLENLAALLVSFAGVVVIGTRGNIAGVRFEDPLGVALAAGSSLVWASYWIVNVRDTREAETKLTQGFIFGLAYVLLGFVSRGPRLLPWEGMLASLYVGLFEMGVTFTLWLAALKRAERAARISNLVFLSPCLSLVVVHLVVGEPIARSTGLGLGLILLGIVLQAPTRPSA